MHVNPRTSMDAARRLMQRTTQRVQGRPREQRDKPTTQRACTEQPGCTSTAHHFTCYEWTAPKDDA